MPNKPKTIDAHKESTDLILVKEKKLLTLFKKVPYWFSFRGILKQSSQDIVPLMLSTHYCREKRREEEKQDIKPGRKKNKCSLIEHFRPRMEKNLSLLSILQAARSKCFLIIVYM